MPTYFKTEHNLKILEMQRNVYDFCRTKFFLLKLALTHMKYRNRNVTHMIRNNHSTYKKLDKVSCLLERARKQENHNNMEKS